MNEYLQRFKNPGTIISMASIVGLLLAQFGVEVDQAWLDTTIKLVCALGLVLGVMNNPTTGGVDLPVAGKTKASKVLAQVYEEAVTQPEVKVEAVAQPEVKVEEVVVSEAEAKVEEVVQ